jgi:hypothetical protein
MDAISVPAPAINSNASRTVHRAPVIQTVKQIVQLLSEKYTETWRSCNFWHVCRRLIKVCRTHHQHIATSGRGYQKTQVRRLTWSRSKNPSTWMQDQQKRPISACPTDRELKLPDLMICLGASDDITNIHPVQGPSSCIGSRGKIRPSEVSQSDACL